MVCEKIIAAMDTSQPNIFVARQPIFKRNKEVFAYELLFRSGLNNYFDPLQNGEEATSKVITNSFLLIGIASITEGKKAFINFSEEMLLKGYPTLFPKDWTTCIHYAAHSCPRCANNTSRGKTRLNQTIHILL